MHRNGVHPDGKRIGIISISILEAKPIKYYGYMMEWDGLGRDGTEINIYGIFNV